LKGTLPLDLNVWLFVAIKKGLKKGDKGVNGVGYHISDKTMWK
jgi:hypothetical protein